MKTFRTVAYRNSSPIAPGLWRCFFIYFFLVAFAAFSAGCNQITDKPLGMSVVTRGNPPRVVKGLLDLRHWDFDPSTGSGTGGLVKLDGEWEFYWEQLLTPNDFANARARKADHLAQLLNYLKVTEKKFGLLINFGKPRLEWKHYVL